MKARIAMLVVGVMLGSVGTAWGAGYWKQTGSSYVCEGLTNVVRCKRRFTAYEAVVSGSGAGNGVTIFFRGSVVFQCKPGIRPAADCTDFR
jgi:hypothetical protein